jgi:hypothetical protein
MIKALFAHLHKNAKPSTRKKEYYAVVSVESKPDKEFGPYATESEARQVGEAYRAKYSRLWGTGIRVFKDR